MRILFASNNLPFPPNSGGAQRTELLLRCLQDIGEVDCAFLQPERPSPEGVAELNRQCSVKLIASTREILSEQPGSVWSKVIPGRAGRDLEAFADAGKFRWQPHAPTIAQLGGTDQYDLIVARYLQTAITLGLFGRVPLALDVDDFDPDRLRLRLDGAGFWKSLTLRRNLRFSEAAHSRFLPKAAHLWVSNPNDRSHPVLKDAELLPNIPYPDPTGRIPSPAPFDRTSKIFLMVGTMSYSANAEGAESFLKECWPRIIRACPDAEFHLVGSGIPEALRKRWSQVPGVRLLGFVADLSAAYEKCVAAVAPIRAGGGTNIKVLEAASFGRVTVLTKVAQRGFESTLPSGTACLRSDNVSAMADPCIALLRNSAQAEQMGRAARKAVESFYNLTVFRNSVHLGCEKALHRGAIQTVAAKR